MYFLFIKNKNFPVAIPVSIPNLFNSSFFKLCFTQAARLSHCYIVTAFWASFKSDIIMRLFKCYLMTFHTMLMLAQCDRCAFRHILQLAAIAIVMSWCDFCSYWRNSTKSCFSISYIEKRGNKYSIKTTIYHKIRPKYFLTEYRKMCSTILR